jgi:ParB/RepB/Spo0J family partition protein
MGSKQGLGSVAQSRSDVYHIDPRVIKIEDGWNCRDVAAKETQDHIEALALSITEIGVREPLTVYWQDGSVVVTDGHCRLLAVKLAISRGVEIKTVPAKPESRNSNDADRLFSQVVRNSGKPFSALENAKVYGKLLDFGWSQGDIAKKAGISQGRVSQVLALLTMPEPIKQMVAAGEVSASHAQATLSASNGAKALQVLQDAVAVAKAEGKSKATAKHTAAGESAQQPKVKPLDVLWGKVNALGGRTVDKDDEYGRGYLDAISEVLDIIEECGGKNPSLKPLQGSK